MLDVLLAAAPRGRTRASDAFPVYCFSREGLLGAMEHAGQESLLAFVDGSMRQPPHGDKCSWLREGVAVYIMGESDVVIRGATVAIVELRAVELPNRSIWTIRPNVRVD
jgi:hypothetical protein